MWPTGASVFHSQDLSCTVAPPSTFIKNLPNLERCIACRVMDEAVHITLDGCLKASHSRSPRDTVQKPPFLDTFAQRALCFEGVLEHHLLSAVTTGEKSHVQRHAATLHTGEEMVLTFRFAWQTSVRAAYKSIASEPQWVIERVCGEFVELQVSLPSRGLSLPEHTMQIFAVLDRVCRVCRVTFAQLLCFRRESFQLLYCSVHKSAFSFCLFLCQPAPPG